MENRTGCEAADEERHKPIKEIVLPTLHGHRLVHGVHYRDGAHGGHKANYWCQS